MLLLILSFVSSGTHILLLALPLVYAFGVLVSDSDAIEALSGLIVPKGGGKRPFDDFIVGDNFIFNCVQVAGKLDLIILI